MRCRVKCVGCKEKLIKKKVSLGPKPYAVSRAPCFSRRRPICPDCRFCQGCSQDRCRLCRSSRKKVPKKLSISEQIALYDRINKKKGSRKSE